MRSIAMVVAILAIGAVGYFGFIGISSNNRLNDEVGLQTAGTQEATQRVIHFGFDMRSSPEEDARQYLPFLKYLENETGYRFALRFTTEDGKLDEDLANNLVDLAAVGAVSYLSASQSGVVVPLARGLNKAGEASYKSVIVTAPDSGISSIDDLRGKRLAFGSIDSTQGHIIPRLSLNEAGIGLDDLAIYVFTGSHQNCADAVMSGAAEACALQDTLGRTLESEGMLKVVFESKSYPSSGIAANASLPIDVRTAIAAALIAFKPKGIDAEGLYNWDRTEMPNGFIAANSNDYEDMRVSMQSLGLLIK